MVLYGTRSITPTILSRLQTLEKNAPNTVGDHLQDSRKCAFDLRPLESAANEAGMDLEPARHASIPGPRDARYILEGWDRRLSRILDWAKRIYPSRITEFYSKRSGESKRQLRHISALLLHIALVPPSLPLLSNSAATPVDHHQPRVTGWLIICLSFAVQYSVHAKLR